MGADFCFNYIAIKPGTEVKAKEKMLKAIEKFKIPELTKDTKLKIVASLGKSSHEIEDFAEYWEQGRRKDLNEKGMPIDGDEDEIITEEVAKQEMKKTVEDFFSSLEYRDVGSFTHKGETIYITGGMSWGDLPTDSCDVFNAFSCLPRKITNAGKIK